MKTLFQNRNVRIAAAVVVVLFAVWGIRYFLSGRSTVVGEYRLSGLAGWQRKIQQTKLSEAVSYKTRVADNGIFFAFRLLDSPTGKQPPATVQQLEQEVKKRDQWVFSTMSSALGASAQVLDMQQTQYRGMPAIASNTLGQIGNSKDYERRLIFTNGRAQYQFTLSISVKGGGAVAPEAQAEADRVWQKMTEGLEPA